MKSDLIINPFSKITILEKYEKISGLEIEVPIRNKSLRSFKIESDSKPELVEFLVDLTKCGFGQFNPIDLTDNELEFLLNEGFLVDKNFAPNLPLFHFFLDELELENNFESFAIQDLIVNPDFRYEPFDLTKVSHRIKGNNFSAEFPIAWIKLPVTEIEVGYWLRGGFAEFAKNFIAGKKLDFEIERNILAKFIQVGILINTEFQQQKEIEIKQQLESASQKFQNNKYVIFKNILPSHYLQVMKTFFREYISNGFMPFNDRQVKRRFYQHNLPLAQFFHHNFTKLMSIIVGEGVKPSYVYAACYVEEADLPPHIDREQCEYSISFQVDYQPEPKDDVSPWGLYVSPLELTDSIHSFTFPWADYPENDLSNKKSKKINLKSGDGLFYKGRELVHFRYPLPKGHKSTSIFFHYVSKDFHGKLD